MGNQPTSKAPKAEPPRRSFRSRHISAPAHPAQNTIWQLQSRLGNQAVISLLRSRSMQAKLRVSQPGDLYEQEADRVADQVMRMPETATAPSEETQVQTQPLYKGITPLSQRVAKDDKAAVAEEATSQRLPEPELEKGDEEVIAAQRKDDQEAETVQPKPLLQRQAEEEGEESLQAKPWPSQVTPHIHTSFRGPAHVTNPLMQRLCTGCEENMQRQSEEEAELAQPQPNGNRLRANAATPLQPQGGRGQAPQVSSTVSAHIQALRSGGSPLPQATRAFFEPRFGADFSPVRIHTDTRAAETAKAIHARAFTVGRNIAFGAGQYAPESREGRQLLAHELTHVVQQTSSSGQEASIRTQPGMIQKKDSEETVEAEPTAEDKAADLRYSEELKDKIHYKYWGLVIKIAEAQGLENTERRQKWGDTLLDAGRKLEQIFEKESLSLWDVMPLHDQLTTIEAEVKAEDEVAYKLWQRTNERYTSERTRLEEEGDYESELALGYLDQLFDEREPRISKIVATGALVQEDILGFVYILDNQKHVETAKIVVAREREEAQAQLDRLSEVEEEGPGFLETAWSIVGCDSVGECLGDVALTVATAGTGKALKFVVKGGKALKKASKARKVIRSAKQLGKRLHTFLKESKRLKKFVGVVKGAADDAAGTYTKWLKKDWKKIAKKISTDLIANYTTGGKEGATNVATARINKDFIGTLVETELGIPKPDPKTIEVAIVFFLGKKHSVAASLVRTFILQSLKHRTIVNLAFESIRASTPLTEADEIFKRTLTSTVGEVAQDTVQAIPFVADSELLKYVTEAIRKVVQRIFG